MTKKNSSKTATEKAIQASEPRVVSYKGWQGVNIADSPLTWEPLEGRQDDFRQTDLPTNYLMVQNNLNTSPTGGIETRFDSVVIGRYVDDWKFTGVTAVYHHWLFCVARQSNIYEFTDTILYRDLTDNDPEAWIEVRLIIGSESSEVERPANYEICEIGFFEGNLVASVRGTTGGLIALSKVELSSDNTLLQLYGMDWTTGQETRFNCIVDTPRMDDRPIAKPAMEIHGMASSAEGPTEDASVRVEVKFCYTNRLGSALTHLDSNVATMYVEFSPALWTSKKYITVKPATGDTSEHTSVSGVDLYARDTENLDWVFIGHVDVTNNQVYNGNWSYDWYGNMTDITQWLTAQLTVPAENTSHGPDATHFACHDSRMYYWGMPSKPYRLWIGGNPGSEFSVAKGLGGGWIDIEPGSGYDVMGTAKWKTNGGANIVTIMCGNRNTTKVKRFNLVETNMTTTNEISCKGYMYEEVSNVVGCNSRWGYGVFSDGLYSLSRYGLTVTTMAVEYNNQMRSQVMSDAIAPVFTERVGSRLRNGRMTCINDVIYIALAEESSESEPVNLDNVILCYDMGLKSWYTWTHDETLNCRMGHDPDKIKHIFAVDSDEFTEGLGVVTSEYVYLYPTTMTQNALTPDFDILLETGEMVPRSPLQAFWYLQQLELRFDYFVSQPEEVTVLVEGVDYYGRFFRIEKFLNKGKSEYAGEQRYHVEWIRVDKIVESVRLRIKGKGRFRLTHINAKMYQQADTIGTPYGFDARDVYMNRKGQEHEIHHYIKDYNNLRRAVIS